MKTKHLLVFVIFLLVLVSCRDKSERMISKAVDSSPAEMMIAPPPPPLPPGSEEQGSYNPKLVKKGELTISSKDIEATKSCIYAIVNSCRGNITGEKMHKDELVFYIEINLTVQAGFFDRFLNRLDSAKLNIVTRNFTVEDVSMKYIDDSTRLQNKKRLEKKYLELLSKTNDVAELLAIEEKLESVQSDIESREAQLKVLNKKIAYSEFSITIEKYAPGLAFEERNIFSNRLRAGLIQGWDGVKGFMVFLLTIWPLYLFAVIIVVVVKFIVRRRKKKK
jgi:hypothetical protein